MSGKFCSLEPGVGFLEGERGALVPERVTHAEMEANVYVLRELSAWDLSTWTPENTPEQVKLIALRVASAHYILMKYAQGSGNAQPTLPSTWLKQAEAAISEIKAAGFIMQDDGHQLMPKQTASVFTERVR